MSRSKKVASCTANIEPVEIARLTPFHLQSDVFPETSEMEFEELVLDIEESGLRYPILILPNKEIVSGHRRVAAVERLGYTHVDASVQSGLDDEQAEALFYKENFTRRQLTPLQKASCARRLWDLGEHATRKPGESLGAWVGRRLGIGERNANRYFNVMKAPAIVQQAFDQQYISLVNAARVGTARADLRRTIAAEIEQAGLPHAREIIRRRINSRISHAGVQTAYRHLMGNLRIALEQLTGRIDEVNTGGDLHTELWQQVRQLINQVSSRERKVAEEYSDDGQQYFEKMQRRIIRA